MWFLSILLHVGFLAACVGVANRLQRDLPGEETREVGIVIEPTASPVAMAEPFPFPPPEATPVGEPLEHQGAVGPALPIDFFPPLDATSPPTVPSLESATASLYGTAGDRSASPPSVHSGRTGGAMAAGSVSTTRFFDAPATGRSFVFVIDRSGSMAENHALKLARREAATSLRRLAPESLFQVVFYNNRAETSRLDNGRLVRASRPNLLLAERWMESMEPDGGTAHATALQAAFALQPEVIYFLTDAEDMSDEDVNNLTRLNRASRPSATICTIQFGGGPEPEGFHQLRRLAEENDGNYTYVRTGAVRQPK